MSVRTSTEAHFERLTKHEVVAGDVLVASLGELTPAGCLAPASLGPAIVTGRLQSEFGRIRSCQPPT